MRTLLKVLSDKNPWLMVLVFALAADARANTLVKANNANPLNDVNSWAGGTATPGSGDTAEWDFNVTAANTVGLGASATWGGILVTNPGGNVTITNDGSTLTLGAGGIDLSGATKDLYLYCPLIFNNAETINVTNTHNLYISNTISGGAVGITKIGAGTVTLYSSNNFSGLIALNAGTLTLANSNAWPGAASLTFNGGVLGINSGIICTNLTVVPTNTTAALNVSCSGIIPQNLTINAGTNSASPNANATPTIPTGWVQANLSASIAAGGYITNNGTLVINTNSQPALGTIVGTGGLGGIQDKATPAAGHTFAFQNGSYFSYFQPYSNSISPTVLQVTGNGSVAFRWFGYNDAAGIVYTNILNGGTWTFGSVGQNNSSCHYVGTCIVSNGASVSITNNIKYVHGTWNVVSNSSLTFVSPTPTDSLTANHAANNFGLNLSAGQNGTIYVGNNGLQVGFGQQLPNLASETNSLSVNVGGTVIITNFLTLGVVGENKFLETDAVNLSGGKLIVMNSIQPAGGTLTTTNSSPSAIIYPTNIFNWTGGQLTALSINVSNGLATSILTNSTPLSVTTVSPAIMGGNFSASAFTNLAGILAPGDTNAAGKTTISHGDYVQLDAATLDIDIGGTNVASTFQTNSAPGDGSGWYDNLNVSAGTFYAGGTLHLRFVNGFIPTQTQQFTIINYQNISGNFTNLNPSLGGSLGRLAVENGTPGATFNVVTNLEHTAIYLTDYHVVGSGNSVAPTNVLASVANISGTNNIIIITGSGGSGSSGYTILSATNLAAPLANWVTNATAQPFGTGGSINYTNPVNPSFPQQFYRIRVP